MADCFVDVAYRGLELGRRVKLRDLTLEGAYLEAPFPMPVGSTIQIHTDEGVRFEAQVDAIFEQVGGRADAPGMRIRPIADAEPAKTWWSERAGITPVPPEPVESPEGRTEVMTAVQIEEIEATASAEGDGDGDADESDGSGDGGDGSSNGRSNGHGGRRKKKKKR